MPERAREVNCRNLLQYGYIKSLTKIGKNSVHIFPIKNGLKSGGQGVQADRLEATVSSYYWERRL